MVDDEPTLAARHRGASKAMVTALLTAAVLVLMTGIAAAWTTAAADPGERIEICHATRSENQPYVVNRPAAAGDANGHMGHVGDIFEPGMKDRGEQWGDIIPPFTFDGEESPGLNWPEGMAIFENGCQVLDVCPEPGDQPPGTECEVPPVDECPDDPGTQTDPAECAEQGGGGGGEEPGNGTEEPSSSGPGVTVAGEQASTSGAGGDQAASAGTPAVPSSVDAGLEFASTGPDSTSLGLGLVGFGLLLMVGSGLPGLVRTGRR